MLTKITVIKNRSRLTGARQKNIPVPYKQMRITYKKCIKSEVSFISRFGSQSIRLSHEQVLFVLLIRRRRFGPQWQGTKIVHKPACLANENIPPSQVLGLKCKMQMLYIADIGHFTRFTTTKLSHLFQQNWRTIKRSEWRPLPYGQKTLNLPVIVD